MLPALTEDEIRSRAPGVSEDGMQILIHWQEMYIMTLFYVNCIWSETVKVLIMNLIMLGK